MVRGGMRFFGVGVPDLKGLVKVLKGNHEHAYELFGTVNLDTM